MQMGAFAQAGRGGPKDSDAAKAYYEKAAALGSARPVDTPERFVRSPEAPTLLVSGGPAPMPRDLVMPFIR